MCSWTAWHLPGVLSGSYGDASPPLAFRLACFSVMVFSGAIILAWLRLRSGSIWPAAIFHTTHNGTIQTFYERLTSPTDLTAFVGGEFGLAVPFYSLMFAGWILWKHGRRAEVKAPEAGGAPAGQWERA